nr:reverse transcriptase domain-containing protein [Tanacetum cinerariifolium]
MNDVSLKAMQNQTDMVKNELINEMKTSIQTSLSNQTNKIKNMMASLLQMNTASTSGTRTLPGNTIANPKGELKAITTRSGLVTEGPTVPNPPKSVNPEEDECVEETYTNPDHAEYNIKVPPPPSVQKPKPPIQRNFVLHTRDSLLPHIPYPSRMLKQKHELKCKALADLGASINLMPLSVWKKLGLPDLILTRMTLELANRAICTPDEIARDVFVPVGKFTFPADFVVVDYESDPRVPLILGRPFLRTARALIDVHGEEMILRDGDERFTLNMKHDTASYSNHPYRDSVNLINIFNLSSEEDCLKDLVSNKQSGNPTFSLHKEIALPEVIHEFNDSKGYLLHTLLETCTTLTRRVEHLEQDKIAQTLEITKLTQKLKKLERRNKLKVSKLRILKKGEIIATIDADEDVTLKDVVAVTKDVAAVEKDDEIEENDDDLKPAELKEVVEVVTTAKLMTEVVTAASATITAASATITAATTPINVATITVAPSAARRRKGVLIKDPEETATPSIIIHFEPKSKDKGKGILVEEPKPLKKQAQIEQDEAYARELEAELNKNINWDDRKSQTEAQARKNMMIYLRNMAGFKMDYFKGMSYDDICLIFKKYFNPNVDFLEKTKEQLEEEEDSRSLKRKTESQAEKATKKQKLDEDVKELKKHLQIVPNDEDDVYTEATPLARKVPVIDYEIYTENNKPYYKIIRADGSPQLFLSFLSLLRNFDREDLEVLCSSMEESKNCSWFNKGQKLKTVRVLWSTHYNIYTYTDDLAGREKISTNKCMRTRSSSNLPVESPPNPSTSYPKHRNRRRSKQPFILEESPVDTMADQRTMAELLRALIEEAIMVLSILAEQFELKHNLINMMTSDQFFRLEKDNPHDHICWFNKITSTIKYKDVPNSSIKLMLFPFSLTGAARRLLEKEPPRSILTWEDLQQFDKSFHEAWDRLKDLLRACPHHGFTELHQLDTFYNALNPADQDSLNSTTCGNLLERRTQDVLTIIKNKSKARNSRNKSVVSQVKSSDANSNSSSEIAKLTHAVNQQTSAVTTAMTAILKQFQATSPPTFVKAVEETCVTCGGAHPYYQCLATDGNTFPELTDNIQGYVAAAAFNYNQGNFDPGKFLNLCGFSEIKCKALADLGASINLMPLSVWKKLGLPKLISTRMTLELANRAICTPVRIARDVFIPVGKFTFPVDFVIVDYESDPKVLLILGRPFLRTARALIDVHGEEMILRDDDERLTLNMRHDTSSYSNQPQKESINMINIYDNSSEDFLEKLCTTNHKNGSPTFSSHPELALSKVKDDVFDPEGGNVLIEKLLDLDSTKDLHPPHRVSTTSSSSPNHLLEEFTDELTLITLPPRNDDLSFDIESNLKVIEYMLHHDPIKDIDSILKDSIDQSNLVVLNDNLVDIMPEMFTDEHALDYSSPLIYDEYDYDLFEVKSDTEYVYDDPFDSKGEKIKESKLLIDEIDLLSDFLPSSEYDSFLSEDFSVVDALPSTNNEDKVFNPGILIQETLFEIITHVSPDKNAKKLAISHSSLILEDFDPPLYELSFFKEVPRVLRQDGAGDVYRSDGGCVLAGMVSGGGGKRQETRTPLGEGSGLRYEYPLFGGRSRTYQKPHLSSRNADVGRSSLLPPSFGSTLVEKRGYYRIRFPFSYFIPLCCHVYVLLSALSTSKKFFEPCLLCRYFGLHLLTKPPRFPFFSMLVIEDLDLSLDII